MGDLASEEYAKKDGRLVYIPENEEPDSREPDPPKPINWAEFGAILEDRKNEYVKELFKMQYKIQQEIDKVKYNE